MSERQPPGIDRTDERILRVLERQGRIPFVELARQVNLTPTPCVARVRRLEREGIIEGYKAVVNAERLGLGLAVFVEVKLDHTSSDVLERFQKMVLELDELAECYLIAGDYDYLLKVQIESIAAYRHFLSEALPRLPDVQQTCSYIVIEQLKSVFR